MDQSLNHHMGYNQEYFAKDAIRIKMEIIMDTLRTKMIITLMMPIIQNRNHALDQSLNHHLGWNQEHFIKHAT